MDLDKLAEAARAEHVELTAINRLLMNLKGAFFLRTKDQVYTASNYELNRYLGIDLVGVTVAYWWTHIVHPDDVAHSQQYFEDWLEGRTSYPWVTNRIKALDGSYSAVRWTSVIDAKTQSGLAIGVFANER